jgi:hypothetical protein
MMFIVIFSNFYSYIVKGRGKSGPNMEVIEENNITTFFFLVKIYLVCVVKGIHSLFILFYLNVYSERFEISIYY